MTNNTSDKTNETIKTYTEKLQLTGNELIKQVQELIKQGNVRRLILKDQNGKTLIEMPLTIGVAAGLGLTAFAWPLAALGAIAALATHVQLLVERYENPADAERDAAEQIK